MAAALQRGMTICDGRGGALSLDLSRGELRWLVDGCRSLIAGAVPPGASMLKVHAGNTVYLLNYRSPVDDAAELQITDLYDPTQRVVLPPHLAEMIAALVERFLEAAQTRALVHLDG
jgi:hypothetical protein